MRLREQRAGIVVAAVVLLGGCTQIPVVQLGEYRQAFAHAQEASETILLDYDQALKESRAFLRARQSPDETVAPYALTWAEASREFETRAPDDIEVRRLAFKVVADYNEVLVQLAEGKSVDQVRTQAGGLLGSINKFVSVAGGAAIPGFSAITSIVLTLAEQFEKARLREEFVQAVEKGAPIVQKILDVLIADIGTHYGQRATLLTRERLRAVAAMRSTTESIQAIAGAYNVPAADLERIHKEVNEALVVARSEIRDFPVKIEGGGQKGAAYSPVVAAQLRGQQRELQRLAGIYTENVKAGKSLTALLGNYGRLLQKTQLTLKSLVEALKQPKDIAAATDELLGLAFGLRRDLEDLRAARNNR